MLFRSRRASETNSVNIREVIDFVLASIQHPMMQQVLFNVDVEGVIQCNLDSFRIRIILRQAIMNALQFAAVSNTICEISIRATLQDFQLKLTVEDNGPGFPEQILEQRKSFIQRGSVESSGLGIGISTMQEAAQRMRGELKLSNLASGGAQILLVAPVQL